jgi:hypothetical protein
MSAQVCEIGVTAVGRHIVSIVSLVATCLASITRQSALLASWSFNRWMVQKDLMIVQKLIRHDR